MREIEQAAEEEIRNSLKRDVAPDDEALAVRIDERSLNSLRIPYIER